MPVESLTYQSNSCDYFNAIRHLPQPIFLDSCAPHSLGGRYDIIAANPVVSLITEESTTVIQQSSSDKTVAHKTTSNDNPLAIAKHYLEKNSYKKQELDDCSLPFYSGLLFVCSYDLARHLETLPSHAVKDIAFPEFYGGIYPWAIIQDHQEKKAWLTWQEGTDKPVIPCHTTKTANAFILEAPFSHDMSVAQYNDAFNKTKNYILDGDIYQANISQRFFSTFKGDPFLAYQALREKVPSPYSAYIEINKQSILSLSPECFLKVQGNKVLTFPIKGTRSRGDTPQADDKLKHELQSSAKDNAENVMIVDLLRNDLGRCCIPGSINVEKLCQVESFANVHHLVSTITGALAQGTKAIDVLHCCFPGGSITGAPKIRAMQIIDEVETHRRSIYCGSIGYICHTGNMDSNIAIRTLLCDEQSIYCWGGGGIVADSDATDEYAESLTKVRRLMSVLEQL